MNKITGNELLHYNSDQNCVFFTGIPIRLHIAAMVGQSMLEDKGRYGGFQSKNEWAQVSLEMADALIAAYNNTPNPNEKD